MSTSQSLLAVLKEAEFEDRGKGVVVKIHSRHVSAHELKETLKTMFPRSKYTIQVSNKLNPFHCNPNSQLFPAQERPVFDNVPGTWKV